MANSFVLALCVHQPHALKTVVSIHDRVKSDRSFILTVRLSAMCFESSEVAIHDHVDSGHGGYSKQ